MTRDEAFEFLDRTARGIAEMFGSSCETLVHDMGVPSHPILSIYNGHVSGREVGSTMDILGIGLVYVIILCIVGTVILVAGIVLTILLYRRSRRK